MKLTSVLLFLLLPLMTNAQSWEWTKGGGAATVHACVTDTFGNVYTAGIISSPVAEPYVTKYDSSGTIAWTINGNMSGTPQSLATDLFGNEYFLGVYDTLIIFGGDTLRMPGPLTGMHHYFIAKISAAGSVEWLKNFGTTVSLQAYGQIKADHKGDIYISCTFSDTAVIGSYTLINAMTDESTDILAAKLDSSGNVIWAKRYGGRNYDYPTTLSITTQGKVYIAGFFTSDTLSFGSTLLFDTGATSGNQGIYLAKLDSSGNPIWAKGAGGGAIEDAYADIVTDANDNVFTTGYYTGAMALGTYILPSGNKYGFVARYDSSGAVSWVKSIVGARVQPWTMATDPCGDVWVSASIDGLVDTIDGHVLPLVSGTDPILVAGWDSSGSYLQAVALASGGSLGSSIAIDKYGGIYAEAEYSIDTFIVGNDTLYNVVGSPINFLAKYNPNLGCRAPVSVKEYSIQTGLSLYPNPASAMLTIAANELINRVQISDLVGKTIYTQSSNAKVVQVDISYLPAGVYLVRVNNTQVRKFVKD